MKEKRCRFIKSSSFIPLSSNCCVWEFVLAWESAFVVKGSDVVGISLEKVCESVKGCCF